MTAETKEKKIRERVFKKSYGRLVREKERVEGALQSLVTRQKDAFFAGREALLDMTSLKIKGGPHDLSGRLRDYLYGL